MMEQIVLCEPQCCGFEHAHFNAAFLDTLLLACPDAHAVFVGEQEHLKWVRHTLLRFDAPAVQRVEWQALDIPPRSVGGLGRLREEWGAFEQVLRCVVNEQIRLLVWTSITNTGLLVLKLRLHGRHCGFPVLAVVHELLSSLDRLPRNPCKWAFNLRYLLRLAQPASLRYIALGDSICDSLNQMQPALPIHFRSLDHPYFEGDLARDEEQDPHHNTLRFGYMGIGHTRKGFHIFARLAEEVREQSSQVEFLLVGFLAGTCDDQEYPWVTGVTRQPLSAEEYGRRATSLTYTVCSADPEHYRLVASASFLDGLSFGKPGIYLRNPYIDHYVTRMGDIGYLCDSYEEMRDTVLSIVQEFPTERYRQQCENIRHGRKLFTPQRLASRLTAIIYERQEIQRNRKY